MISRFVAKLLHFTSRRYRLLFVVCLVTLAMSIGVVGTVLFVHWQADRAVRSETRFILQQTQQQFVPVLQNRRRTLIVLSRTLAEAPTLNPAEQRVLANNVVEQTPYLLGLGLQVRGMLSWWVPPVSTTLQERTQILRDLSRRIRRPRGWRTSATMTLMAREDRPLLVMIEPVRVSGNVSAKAIVAFFDLRPLLADFFKVAFQQPYPVQVLEGPQRLYRAERWQPAMEGYELPVADELLKLNDLQWTLQVQSRSVSVVPSQSWMMALLITFGVLAALAILGMLWTIERLRHLATTDELTGVSNRRLFLERWRAEHARATRYQRDLSCLMIDIDGFKQVNDALGHHVGDVLLKRVAQELKTGLRETDFIARYGGDEFIVGLSETNLEQAQMVATKLRHLAIQGPWVTHQVGPIHLSVGVSQMRMQESPEDVIKRADANLYALREAARRPTMFPTEPSSRIRAAIHRSTRE